MTALVETDGDVVERYIYDPYGKPLFLAADWSLQENGDVDGIASNYANEILFTGHRLDRFAHRRNRPAGPHAPAKYAPGKPGG